MMGVELEAKRLSLLREAIPTVAVIAMLVNPSNVHAESQVRAVQRAAHAIDQQVVIINASTGAKIQRRCGQFGLPMPLGPQRGKKKKARQINPGRGKNGGSRIQCMAQSCFRRVSSWRSFGFVLPPGPFICAQWSCASTRGSGMGVHGLAQMLAMAASRTSAWRRRRRAASLGSRILASMLLPNIPSCWCVAVIFSERQCRLKLEQWMSKRENQLNYCAPTSTNGTSSRHPGAYEHVPSP